MHHSPVQGGRRFDALHLSFVSVDDSDHFPHCDHCSRPGIYEMYRVGPESYCSFDCMWRELRSQGNPSPVFQWKCDVCAKETIGNFPARMLFLPNETKMFCSFNCELSYGK